MCAHVACNHICLPNKRTHLAYLVRAANCCTRGLLHAGTELNATTAKDSKDIAKWFAGAIPTTSGINLSAGPAVVGAAASKL